jgi:hypothetical protein
MIGVIMYGMKAMFGKRLPYFIALLVIEVIVIVIIVIWTFKDTSGVFRSAYDFIGKNSVFFSIFNFIWDYAEAISGVVVLLALGIVFFSFKKWRRDRSINRLHSWARNGVVVLAQYRQEIAADGDSPADRYQEVGILIDKLLANADLALADANILHGEIDAKTKETVDWLRAVKIKCAKEDASLFDDLPDLQYNFAEVMILAFEFIK